MSGQRAVFVDRDGVINELVKDPVSGQAESPLSADAVTLRPDAAAALRSLLDGGWILVGASNQPAAAKGTITLAELEAVQQRVLALLSSEGVVFAAFELCLHHPQGSVEGLAGPCDCRKPAPGMLLRAARTLRIDLASSWMVGDTDGDIAAGRAAGCRTVLVANPGSSHKRDHPSEATATVEDLWGAAALILSNEGVRSVQCSTS